MKANNPLVSIIIPCYNDAQYIEQSVNSALNQTYKHIEVIVVDDGSNSETKAVLKTLEPKITKLITQENKGQSTARNVGISQAQGDYILVLDSDDFFEPTFCEKAIDAFESNLHCKIVTCWANLIYENGTVELYKPNGGDLNTFLINNCALGSVLFKKEDWKFCHGYDEQMRKGFEDWEFYIRLLMHGGSAQVIFEPLFNYRRKLVSTTSKANKIKYELLKHIYFKHDILYKENFQLLISHLLNSIEHEEKEKIKNTQRLEYRLGSFILKPFRFIKTLFRK